MRNGFAQEPIIAKIIEKEFEGSISIEDGMLRAIKRDLYHMGMVLGPNFLRLYLKNYFIRFTYDYLRIIKFCARAQIFTSGTRKQRNNLFFIHHKKYNEILPPIKDLDLVHLSFSKINIRFYGLIKKIIHFTKSKDYKFMHFLSLWVSHNFQDYKEFSILNIFEGDSPLPALAADWARKNHLYVKLYQWGHVNSGKALIAFRDMGVDSILCSSRIVAERLAELNPNSKIEMVSNPSLDANLKKVLFIDQGLNKKYFGANTRTKFFELATLLSQEGLHVDIKMHPNFPLKRGELKQINGVSLIIGSNLAENYLCNYDAVVGIESSVLTISSELGIKTISFNPKLFDKNTFANQKIKQIETYEELKASLDLNCH